MELSGLNFLDNIEDIDFGDPDETLRDQDAVLIYFGAFNGLDEIHKVDIALDENIPAEIGRHDGHEVCMDDTHGTFFTYGDNAEELFKAMRPILKDFDFLDGATVHLQFNKGQRHPLELEFEFDLNSQ